MKTENKTDNRTPKLRKGAAKFNKKKFESEMSAHLHRIITRQLEK